MVLYKCVQAYYSRYDCCGRTMLRNMNMVWNIDLCYACKSLDVWSTHTHVELEGLMVVALEHTDATRH